jgi:hypothetical protein
MAKRGSEKREHPRVEARLAMQLAEETLGEALVTTESLNISRGGVYCESSEYLAPLSKVALTVILPALIKGGRTSMLRTEGVVVRCEALPALRGRKRYQLACCFTGLDADAARLLDQFVSWRALRGRAPRWPVRPRGPASCARSPSARRRPSGRRRQEGRRPEGRASCREARAPKKAARRSTPKKK